MPQTLDQRGTRRAPRFKMAGTFGALLDGNPATLVDLSIDRRAGRVGDDAEAEPASCGWRSATTSDSLRFNAAVAWASFEIPPNSGPRYRAGIKFIDADQGALGGFCRRHKS